MKNTGIKKSVSGSLLTGIMLLLVGQCFGQAISSNQNYIVETTLRVAGKTTDNQVTGLPVGQANRNVQYFDGLGRPIQKVGWQASPGFRDLVQPLEYNSLGRETRKYLPYVSTVATSNGSFKSAALSDQLAFYNNPAAYDAPGVATVTNTAFAETRFETSPLDRVLEQGAPGVSRQLNAGHTQKLEYEANIDGEVKLWVVTSVGATSSASYPAGTLYKITNKDENWIPVHGKSGTAEEFKDHQGRVVLKRTYNSGEIAYSTYYVYDDMGNLRYVLPPAVNENGQASLNSFSETDDAFNQFIYGYHYDLRKRLTEKKIPGKGWEYMVYNQLDQVVLAQDAEQKIKNKWLFNKYDAVGRLIISGIINSSDTRLSWQATIDAQPYLWEKRDNANSNGTGTGYSNLTNPAHNLVQNYHVINYYDDYGFYGNTFSGPSGEQNTVVTGLVSGSKINVLGTNTMLLTTNYYDAKGRVLETKSQNYLGGTDVVTNTWNFTNELLSSARTHIVGGVTTSIVTAHEYDHMGREKLVKQNINGQGEVVLQAFKHNEIGQLFEKQLHSVNGGANFLQKTEYAYNEVGWLASSISDQFSFRLKYEDGDAPQFNGNISNQLWGMGRNPDVNKFSYGYDNLNRLLSATSTGVLMNETITYDAMGNINTLSRDGGTANQYRYSGNRLTSVDNVTATAYDYDANGNAKVDGRTGMAFTYNTLNLPETVNKPGTSISYVYDASGNKLSKTSIVNGVSSTRHYVKGIEYSGNNIDFVLTEEGLARRNSTTGIYSYEYVLKDHLGNARYSFDIYNNAVRRIQQQDYYAFGSVKESGQYVFGEKNRYLYNGKELQEELGQLDYGARFYDPVIGRWNVVDPLAEKSLGISPFAYGNNNPLRFVDPTGMENEDWVLYSSGGNSYAAWDDNVTDQASAEKLYGKGSLYAGKEGMTYSPSGYKISLNSDKSWNYMLPTLDAGPAGPSLSEAIKANRPMLNTAEAISTGTAFFASGALGFTESAGNFLINGVARRASFAEGLLEKGTNVVYQGFDAAGVVRYVGITERTPAVRFAEHLAAEGTGREFLRYEVIKGATGLSREAAKIMEQNLINSMGLMKNGGQLLNRINSIASKYWEALGIIP